MSQRPDGLEVAPVEVTEAEGTLPPEGAMEQYLRYDQGYVPRVRFDQPSMTKLSMLAPCLVWSAP